MPNMSLKKVPMPEQEPNVRNHNFQEVSLGYTKEMAMEEAARCLNCKHKPCVGGCPVNIRIPEFIAKVAEGDFQAAYDIISDTNALPSVSGRVCPQESQCEARCVRAIKGEPVAIGRLERFVADWYRENVNAMPQKPQTNGIKVAVVGSGPASLTCASDSGQARLRGYHLRGLPHRRRRAGVRHPRVPPAQGHRAERGGQAHRPRRGYWRPIWSSARPSTLTKCLRRAMRPCSSVPARACPCLWASRARPWRGVYSANEYLTRINLMKAYREGYDTPLKISGSAAIIGGGNVAMDAARCAKRMGAEHVYVLYRRDEEEMPARKEEVHHAKEEGIEFMLLTNPVKVLDDGTGRVGGLECVKMRLTAPDESGRRAPKVVEGSNFTLEVDTVVMSLGTSPNPLIRSTTPGLETNRKGCLQVDEETMATSRPGVYAGGDAVTGAATVILAMGAGKKAAESMHQYLQEKHSK